jgi:hypothetical protein
MRKRGLATGIANPCHVYVSGGISGSTGQELWSGLPKRKTIQSEVEDARETDPRVLRAGLHLAFPERHSGREPLHKRFPR